MYVSPLGNTPIIDDDSDAGSTGTFGKGYEPRDYATQPTVEFCSPYPDGFIIPEVEWRERIEELERNKATLTDVRTRHGIKTLSQSSTNYCWSFGTVNGIRMARAAAGYPYLDLSPTAVAAQIKGFRNVGGNTFDAIPWIAEHGVPTTEHWPLNRIDRRYVTPEMKADAKRTVLTEWYELPSNNFAAAASCLLRGIPVAMGLSWWGHLICGLTLRSLPNGDFGIEIENSWGEQWGDKGLGVLTRRKATAFDQAAPRVVTA